MEEENVIEGQEILQHITIEPPECFTHSEELPNKEIEAEAYRNPKTAMP
jgi:hypothetical protein